MLVYNLSIFYCLGEIKPQYLFLLKLGVCMNNHT